MVAHPNATRKLIKIAETTTLHTNTTKHEKIAEIEEKAPPVLNKQNRTINSSHVLAGLDSLDRSFLPESVQNELIRLEDDLNEGVITKAGYAKFVWDLIESYVGKTDLDIL